jgi:hypothetical protein
MKKVKISLMVLAITLGIAGAFSNKAFSTNNNKKFIVYQWQQCDASGNVIIGGAYYNNLTLSQAQTSFGCSGSGAYCAVTVDGQNGNKLSNAIFIHKN